MSSTTRLLVLGVVQMFQPVHGYDVRRELVSWHVHEWASVKPGSIYNALKSLTREGLLEVVGTDQVGGRPERTTYRLTPEGAKQFRQLLRGEWWTVRSPIDPLMAALSFIGYLPRAEVIAALEHRAAQIHGLVRHLELAADDIDGTQTPYHVREMHRLLVARIGSELAWSKLFIERLRAGEYVTGDEPPWKPASEPAAAQTPQVHKAPLPLARAGGRQNGTAGAAGRREAGRGNGTAVAGRREAGRGNGTAGAGGRSEPDRGNGTPGGTGRGDPDRGNAVAGAAGRHAPEGGRRRGQADRVQSNGRAIRGARSRGVRRKSAR
jgi:DNA-binding PadR family transcriptional regulator